MTDVIFPKRIELRISTNTKKQYNIGLSSRQPTISARKHLPCSFCLKTLFKKYGLPMHDSQDSASKANAEGTSTPSRRSGTGGSWKKSPERISCMWAIVTSQSHIDE